MKKDALVIGGHLYQDVMTAKTFVLAIAYVMPTGLERRCAVRISDSLRGWRKGFRRMARMISKDLRKNYNTQPKELP